MALSIIYGLLIVVAIVMIPLRIRARRRTLKEIDDLRSSFNQDVKELIKKLEPRTVNGKKRRIHSLEAYLLQEDERQFCSAISKFPSVTPVISYAQYFDVARHVYSLMKKHRVEPFRQLEIRGEPDRYFSEKKEDAWVVAKKCKRPLFPRAMQHSKSMATL